MCREGKSTTRSKQIHFIFTKIHILLLLKRIFLHVQYNERMLERKDCVSAPPHCNMLTQKTGTTLQYFCTNIATTVPVLDITEDRFVQFSVSPSPPLARRISCL